MDLGSDPQRRTAGCREGCRVVSSTQPPLKTFNYARDILAQQPGSQNHAALRLCSKPEPPMAGGEGIWLAETDRSAAPGEVARAGESGLAVRLQLRGTQPAPAAEADRTTTTGKAAGAVCLKPGSGLPDSLQEAGKNPSTQHKPAFQTDFYSTIA